jgi:hypothetical protein
MFMKQSSTTILLNSVRRVVAIFPQWTLLGFRMSKCYCSVSNQSQQHTRREEKYQRRSDSERTAADQRRKSIAVPIQIRRRRRLKKFRAPTQKASAKKPAGAQRARTAKIRDEHAALVPKEMRRQLEVRCRSYQVATTAICAGVCAVDVWPH